MVSVIAAWHCLVLIKLFSAHQFQVQPNDILVVFHSECEIVRDACTFMPLIHQLLCTGLCRLCVFFLCCVYFLFRSNWHRLGHWQKIAASWKSFTACVEVQEEGNPTARNSCHYHWALNAPTVGASLIRGQAWPNIADVARQLGHRVQIPGTPSPCHGPHEVITPLGFFANMTS